MRQELIYSSDPNSLTRRPLGITDIQSLLGTECKHHHICRRTCIGWDNVGAWSWECCLDDERET